jgi:hypothetical protein
MAAWTKRRAEGAEANFRIFQAMGRCMDPASMSAAYCEWLTSSMNRILADMDDVREEALRLAAKGRNSMTAIIGQGTKI